MSSNCDVSGWRRCLGRLFGPQPILPQLQASALCDAASCCTCIAFVRPRVSFEGESRDCLQMSRRSVYNAIQLHVIEQRSRDVGECDGAVFHPSLQHHNVLMQVTVHERIGGSD